VLTPHQDEYRRKTQVEIAQYENAIRKDIEEKGELSKDSQSKLMLLARERMLREWLPGQLEHLLATEPGQDFKAVQTLLSEEEKKSLPEYLKKN